MKFYTNTVGLWHENRRKNEAAVIFVTGRFDNISSAVIISGAFKAVLNCLSWKLLCSFQFIQFALVKGLQCDLLVKLFAFYVLLVLHFDLT